MPSSSQRQEVWNGTRAKTSGGLTKSDLVKNKRGKIVSKKKSTQASNQNNLGAFLREKGKKVPKDQMLRKKGEVSKKPAAKPAPKPVPKSKPVPKAPAAAPKAPKKPPAAKPQKKPKIVRKKSKPVPKGKVNPLTNQPSEKIEGHGFAKGGNVSLDNVKRTKLRPRRKKLQFAAW